MIIRVLFTVSTLGFVLAQDDNKLINVKQIMRDTFDILKNIPPPTNFNQVSKVMFPATTLPPVYYNNNPGNVPQLSPDEYQALLTAQSNRPLTIQQRQILFNLHQKINAQKQYTQTQAGQYNPNQYYQRPPQPQQQQQQQPAIMNPINRIFATPTEKDMERLLRLPADILYKIAEEGHYIDPEDESQGYSHSKTMSELDRPLPAGVSSSDSSNPGLFGNGFSFNVGENNAGQITNPFLTKEDVKEKPTSESKSKQENTTSKPKEKEESQNATKEITYQNSGDKVDKSKPYFVVNNGEWQLVVPQPDDKPALQIPVKDFTKLTEAVARASARSGMPVDMAKMVAAEELHVKSSEATVSPVEVSTTATTTTEAPKKTQKKAEKKVEKTPASAFIQEAENMKSEEEEKAPTPSPTTEEEVITLNGKVYKLVKEEKPKKKKTKKTKKAQTTGQRNVLPQASSTEAPSTTTTPHTPIPSKTVAQAAGVPVVNTMNPVQLPGVNQPLTLSSLSQYQQQPLTYEQQQILAELQQRYLQSQAMLTQQQQPNRQNPYIQNYNAQQLPAAAISAAQQMSQPYYQKVSPPPIIPQMPSVTAQMPMKVQHYPTQAVVSKAAAAPIKIIKETPHHIDPMQSTLPKQKIYSLQELDKFYNLQNSEATTEEPTIKETTTEKVYAPHKQIKIRMNNNNEETVDEDNQKQSKTTVVDATADAIDEEKKRIAELRRRFALERQQLSRRNRAKYEKTTNLEPTTPPTFAITEQHCYNIKNFAKQAGSSNVYQYAISHCHYIENYYPDLKCENVGDYIKVCQQYYATRRMLFS